LGAAVGLIAFANILSWLYNKYKNQTIALLTGFILGSLTILWPWKYSYTIDHKLIPADKFGHLLLPEKAVFFKHYLPQLNATFFWAVIFCILGILTLVLLESWAQRFEKNNNLSKFKSQSNQNLENNE
jgi:putative membrane protein